MKKKKKKAFQLHVDSEDQERNKVKKERTR